jgi:hypothetical protein
MSSTTYDYWVDLPAARTVLPEQLGTAPAVVGRDGKTDQGSSRPLWIDIIIFER